MYDLMIDRIIQVDAKHAQHDDGYFVFEEMIRDVLLYWSRDDWIKDNIRLDYLEQRGNSNSNKIWTRIKWFQMECIPFGEYHCT